VEEAVGQVAPVPPSGAGLDETGAGGLAVDASAVLPFADEMNTLSATVHVPAPEHDGPPRAVLVCWPGGSYSRAYWDMHIPGHPGYSFAEHMTDRGFVVIAVDPLGVGASSRPSDVDAVNLETMAAAAAEFVRQLRTLMAVGELDSRLAPLEDVPLVAVGHSLGGCLAIVEQALHGSYDAVANLGFTHGGKEVIESGPNEDAASPMQVAIDQAKAFLATGWEAGYGLAPRALHHGWLHAADVPAEVIAADDEKASAWPRQSYVGALLAGHSATYAGRLTCPVLIAFGDRDVPERPHDDVAFYRASQDVTLLVLTGSAHCHNFAATRSVLWDRLGTWAAAAADYLSGGAASTA
jgi:pimeloyl-ACP methyl ester carboxylesterase